MAPSALGLAIKLSSILRFWGTPGSVKISSMRRWFSIFLLVFLPLQFSWTMAASYCLHETDQTAQHFGHHEHKHQANDVAKDAKGSLVNADNDCAVCHAGCLAAMTSTTTVVPIAEIVTEHLQHLHYQVSLYGDQPERPNWFFPA